MIDGSERASIANSVASPRASRHERLSCPFATPLVARPPRWPAAGGIH
jgi:hypothetical protein